MGGSEQKEGLGMKLLVLCSCVLWLATVLKLIVVSNAQEDDSVVPALFR